MIAYILDGTLLSAKSFASESGLSLHSLPAMIARGELFSMNVDGRAYYPAALLGLSSEFCSKVCHSLVPLDDLHKFVFMLRAHPVLDGLTVEQAYFSGEGDRVVALALEWAAERSERVPP